MNYVTITSCTRIFNDTGKVPGIIKWTYNNIKDFCILFDMYNNLTERQEVENFPLTQEKFFWLNNVPQATLNKTLS